MNEQSMTLDLRKAGFGKRVVIRQNDYHGITLVVDVTDGSKAYSVPAGARCFLMARMLGSYVRDGGCTVEGGRIVYTADERMFGASGTAEAYFRIEVGGAAYSTEGFQLVVERAADSYAQLSKAYDTEVDQAIRDAYAAAAKAGDAAEGAKAAEGRADASAKKADEAAAKAEAWAGKVDDATASATDAAEKADTAAQQATAAANKVFPAADNILVGEASGTVAHVEDAFEGAALRGIAVEGACRQDGIPSPENPVPIEVVENPVLWATGANLLNPTQLESSGYFYSAVSGELQINRSDGRGWQSVAQYGVLPAGTYRISGDNIEVRRAADNASLASTNGAMASFALDAATPVKIKVGFGHPDGQYPYVSHAMLLASSGKDVVYAPYVGASLPFALPAEHPYLAKLPDGTADEIVVDEAGNAELVARVSKAIIDTSRFVDWGKGKALYAFPKDGRYAPQGGASGRSVVCEKLEAKDGPDIYKGLGVGISVGSSIAHIANCTTVLFLGDGADPSSIDGASFYYPLMNPVRYKLAPIEMPKAQDGIVNAWADAEVAPSTSIRYIRDVNIVVANIESAIASITQG